MNHNKLLDLVKRIKKYSNSHKVPAQIIFIIVGLLSTIWFLIRVIPKPSRALYPCMQAAAPFMSGFIVYLVGLSATIIAYKKAKLRFANSKYITAALLLLVSIFAAIFTFTTNSQKIFANSKSLLVPNQPIGEARGINPGRVVWVWNPDATNKNCSNRRPSDGYWKNYNTDLEVVEGMMDDAVNNLVGKESIKDSWNSIFHYFNGRKGKGDIGYSDGEKIFIKLNLCKARLSYLNSDYSIDSTSKNEREYGRVATSPQTIIAVVRQLVNECGIADTNITLGDPHKNIFKHLYNPLYSEFPGLVFLTHDGGTGRLKVSPANSPSVFYSDRGSVIAEKKDYLCKTMEAADYLINIAAVKGHAASGVTMNAKNHFGSIAVGDGSNSEIHVNASHLHKGLVNDGAKIRGDYGMYRVIVDLMGHKYIGENTLLFIVDGLWSAAEAVSGTNRWKSPPFNNDYPSSIFISQDNVAIESVCFDFLAAEYTIENYPSGDSTFVQMPAVDDYLFQAADSLYWPSGIVYDPENDGTNIPSLGVFEHWNNPLDKQYTRNLGIGSGIELIKVFQDQTGVENSLIQNPSSFKLYNNYPNPFNPSTTIKYELNISSKIDLSIYNQLGQKVKTLAYADQSAGKYEVQWNADGFASGVYYYSLISETGFVETKKLILLK